MSSTQFVFMVLGFILGVAGTTMFYLITSLIKVIIRRYTS